MIPGIIKIGFFDASILPDFTNPVLPGFSYDPEWIDLAGMGSLSEETTGSPLNSDVNTTLEFATVEEIMSSRPIAFIVEDAGGTQYLIGNCPPHCGVLTKRAQINTPSDKASINYYTFSIPVPKYQL